MGKNVLKILLLCLCTFQLKAQTYKYTMKIAADSSFLDYKEGITQVENSMQSYFRKMFFENSLIYITTDGSWALEKIIPFFIQMHRPNIASGGKYLDTVRYKDGSQMNFSSGTGAGDGRDSLFWESYSIYDYKKAIHKKITYEPQLYAKCEDYEICPFKKTKETKIIRNWLCYKWVPKDEKIQNDVWAWVCDTIPQKMNFHLGNQFSGGVVKVAFNRGFSYDLIEYNEIPDADFISSKNIPCDSTISKVYNFVYQTLGSPIAPTAHVNFE